MDRRDFLAVVCLLPAGAALAAPAAPAPAGLSLPAAINKAGRQRMLSQRTAKAWLMLVQGVLPEKAKSILAQSLHLFDQQLAELKALPAGDEVRSAWLQVEQEWGRYRPLLADIRSDAKAVWAGNEALLGATQKLTLAYEKAAGTSAGRLVNLAGRQRMLSQRMAKAYFFRQMGVNAGLAGEMLDAAVKEFAKAQEELKAAAQNTAQIKTELGLVEQQWFFFQNALSLREAADRKKASTDVATTSERILEQMDAVVGLYEKIAREG
ncbi:MAG TPA: type IV pili methyl-accepting chemotaxis transducer N-terminal domain-containing protein [Zoogloea sp.]|nr:type IV pili methyl-accepting chemotaxis transducer N-terminal domain-containing protein [Zoogloea sp.]HQE37829.1 type IV pili methyl-accepting chemotaxis transducer N-terminal domain-containing protein [Zoogloea sp.]